MIRPDRYKVIRKTDERPITLEITIIGDDGFPCTDALDGGHKLVAGRDSRCDSAAEE